MDVVILNSWNVTSSKYCGFFMSDFPQGTASLCQLILFDGLSKYSAQGQAKECRQGRGEQNVWITLKIMLALPTVKSK